MSDGSDDVASDDVADEGGEGGGMHGSMLHFRVVQTLKNLAVKIPSASSVTNESNKRSMRFCLPVVVEYLNVVGDKHMIHIVLEFIYVLCFDELIRRDLYNEFSLDLKLRDLATSDPEGLKKIVSDLRRLKSHLETE